MRSARLIDLVLAAILMVVFFTSTPAIARQDDLAAFERALTLRGKTLAPADVARALNNLADLYRCQGRYSNAEPLQRRALEITEKTFGSEHPNVAITLDNLALLYQYQGRYAAAEPLYKRALEIWEKARGLDNPDGRRRGNDSLLYGGYDVSRPCSGEQCGPDNR